MSMEYPPSLCPSTSASSAESASSLAAAGLTSEEEAFDNVIVVPFFPPWKEDGEEGASPACDGGGTPTPTEKSDGPEEDGGGGDLDLEAQRQRRSAGADDSPHRSATATTEDAHGREDCPPELSVSKEQGRDRNPGGSARRSGPSTSSIARKIRNVASLGSSSGPPPTIRNADELQKRIAEGRWDAVLLAFERDLELSSIELGDGSSTPLFSPSDLSRALRSLCRLRPPPPPDVGLLLLDLCPEAASRPDPLGTGRYPLHGAVEHGASDELIEALVEAHPLAASAVDGSGRTPLHELCDGHVRARREERRKREEEAFRRRKKKRRIGVGVPLKGRVEREKSEEEEEKGEEPTVDQSMRSLVRVLRRAAPRTINVEDSEGKAPLDYAVENCCGAKAVEAMHAWSFRDWGNRKNPDYELDDEEVRERLWNEKKDVWFGLYTPRSTPPSKEEKDKKDGKEGPAKKKEEEAEGPADASADDAAEEGDQAASPHTEDSGEGCGTSPGPSSGPGSGSGTGSVVVDVDDDCGGGGDREDKENPFDFCRCVPCHRKPRLAVTAAATVRARCRCSPFALRALGAVLTFAAAYALIMVYAPPSSSNDGHGGDNGNGNGDVNHNHNGDVSDYTVDASKLHHDGEIMSSSSPFGLDGYEGASEAAGATAGAGADPFGGGGGLQMTETETAEREDPFSVAVEGSSGEGIYYHEGADPVDGGGEADRDGPNNDRGREGSKEDEDVDDREHDADAMDDEEGGTLVGMNDEGNAAAEKQEDGDDAGRGEEDAEGDNVFARPTHQKTPAGTT